jgi:endonuclease/exonuclease/phosphatase family metal-dependent hydrolase
MKNIFSISILLLLFACAKTTNFRNSYLPTDYVFAKKDTLSILTWNVEHFVDANDNPYIRNEMEDKPKEVEKRIELLANMLRKINADIVILEEFESRNLAMKIAKEKLGDLGYRFFGGNESPDWYMNIIVMSKLPLGLGYSYGNVYAPIENFKDSLGRQETQSNVNNRIFSTEVQASKNFSFYLTGVHLKAGRNKRDTAVRIGQMKLLQAQAQRFLQEDKNAKMLIVGDFNAVSESAELKVLLENKNVPFIDPLANTTVFSHPSTKPFWRIDHILLNPMMSKYLCKNGVTVAENLDKEQLKQISDHLPMLAKFIVK